MDEKQLKTYNYVGAESIHRSVINYPIGTQIKSQLNLQNWLETTQQKPNHFGCIEATFIIDLTGYLRLAHRHSEHVACSGGQPVLSAGEIFLNTRNDTFEVIEISNQSTGFCPEPKSWSYVADALNKIPLVHPNKFTIEFQFRRCPDCQQLNIIKENLFVCDVCRAELPLIWNCEG